MIRLLLDEHIDKAVARGLRRCLPEVDVERVAGGALQGAADPVILEHAASGRIVVTRDRATMPSFACKRVEAGLPMPGVIVLRSAMSVGTVIDELLLILGTVSTEEMANEIWYVST